MKRIIQLLFLVFVLFTIVVVNIRGLLQNYYGFYFSENKERVHRNQLYRALSFVHDNRFYNLFNTYSGLETGYGFFAPNVASDFIVNFTFYDTNGKMVANNNFVEVGNKETVIRITTAYNMFLSYKPGDTLNPQYLKCIIFLKGLSLNNLQKVVGATSVRADLYLFHYPLLAQLKEGKIKKPVYVFYTSKTYSLHDIPTWQ